MHLQNTQKESFVRMYTCQKSRASYIIYIARRGINTFENTIVLFFCKLYFIQERMGV